MLEAIFGSKSALIADIVIYVMAFNVMIMGMQKALDMIKDKTKSNLDNQISAIMHKVTDFLSKGLDWIGANRKH